MRTVNRHRMAGPLMCAVVVGLSGCLVPTESEQSQLQTDLNEARQRWESQSIQDYFLRQRNLCFCDPEISRLTEIEVRDGIAVGWLDVESGEPVDPGFRSAFRSVTRLFDLIQDAIDREAASIIVEYQTSLGYPLNVAIDYDAAVGDDDVRYETVQITTFQ